MSSNNLNTDILEAVLCENYPTVNRNHIQFLIKQNDSMTYDKTLSKISKILDKELEDNVSFAVPIQRHFMDFSRNW